MTDDFADEIGVVLCDDHRVVLAGLERLVQTFENVRVLATASNGAEAIEAVRVHRPTVVLMDLQMPGVDGVAATREIRRQFPNTAVVILTSFSDRGRIKDALDAGAVGYQLKDATPFEIEQALRAAARGEAPIASKAAMALLRVDEVPVLSEREMETLSLVATGLANKAIARRLGITEATVKAHLTSTFRRIGVENRTQAARWFERQEQER
jgi:DNA-binding NarL/FixJ family response regulator